jgi:hypothetical protein
MKAFNKTAAKRWGHLLPTREDYRAMLVFCTQNFEAESFLASNDDARALIRLLSHIYRMPEGEIVADITNTYKWRNLVFK